MAPTKRNRDGDAPPPPARVTRSSTGRLSRYLNRSSATATPPPEPKKRTTKKKAKTDAGAQETAVADGGKETPVADGVVKTEEVADGGEETAAVVPNGKTIVIEHCKQCNSFKTRAVQVKSGLEDGVPGITVLVNPEKPRKGCFEIREEGGEKFITLLDMPRPFEQMKDLDMDKVITDIIEKIK